MNIKIETQQHNIVISDLNIVLQPGVPVWITPKQYSSSSVLKSLESLGTVTCKRQTARVIHHIPRAPVRTAKMSRPGYGGLLKSKETLPQPTQDIESLVQKAVQQATQQTLDQVMSSLQGMLSGLTPQQPQPNVDIQNQVQSAITEALKGVSIGGHSVTNSKSFSPDDPLFIPSKIVSDVDQNNVQITSTQTQSDNQEDVLASLKALKKLRKK